MADSHLTTKQSKSTVSESVTYTDYCVSSLFQYDYWQSSLTAIEDHRIVEEDII